MCWETIGCKPCGDVDHAEENSTQIFNYIYIFLRVNQDGTVGMGVPYNGCFWMGSESKESNKRKEVLLSLVLQTEENVVEGSWQFGGSLTFLFSLKWL